MQTEADSDALVHPPTLTCLRAVFFPSSHAGFLRALPALTALDLYVGGPAEHGPHPARAGELHGPAKAGSARVRSHGGAAGRRTAAHAAAAHTQLRGRHDRARFAGAPLHGQPELHTHLAALGDTHRSIPLADLPAVHALRSVQHLSLHQATFDPPLGLWQLQLYQPPCHVLPQLQSLVYEVSEDPHEME